jgi:hypothetical protein
MARLSVSGYSDLQLEKTAISQFTKHRSFVTHYVYPYRPRKRSDL